MNPKNPVRVSHRILVWAIALTTIPATSLAAHVRFDLPATPTACSASTISQLSGSARLMALVDKGFWNRYGLFYDIEHQCTVKIFVIPGTQFKGDYHTPFVQRQKDFLTRSDKPGAIYKVTSKQIEGQQCFTDLEPLISKEAKYEDYSKAVASRAEEARLDAVKFLNPRYEKEDAILRLSYDGIGLKITNKSGEFVTVSSVSTYYQDKINTLSNLNLELPPESTDTNTITYFKMFTDEMRRSGSVKVRDIPTTHGTLRFGFAIKYLVNGTPKNFYSVHEYDKQGLLAGMK